MGKNQEKIKEALDRIEDGLAAINSDENWLSYLCFQSKFYNYSFGNTVQKISALIINNFNDLED